MVLENLHVRHTAFGEGTIIENDGKYITVQFSAAKKKFVYPDLFEKFLTLADGTVNDDIVKDLNTVNAAKNVIIAAKKEENYRAMTRGIVIPGKENVPEEEDEEARKNSESEEA